MGLPRYKAARDLRLWVSLVLVGAFACGVLSAPETASAQSGRSTSTLGFAVPKTTSFEVMGAPKITVMQPGSWAKTKEGAASYALVTNKGVPKHIKASLDRVPPEGLTLEVRVHPPQSKRGGKAVPTSTGWTSLGTSESVVLKNVKKVSDRDVPISYRARAPAATEPGSYVFTVTYTISTVH